MTHWTNGWFVLSGYFSRRFILSVFRPPPDTQPFWSIKRFSCLPAKPYKSFPLLCIMSCIMHWQAAIKTFILLSSYSGWNPSSGVLFNFGCFSRRFLPSSSPPFYLFFPPPTPSILSLLCFHTCFLLSSQHFLPSASISNIHCFLPGLVRQDTEPACEGGAGRRTTQNCQ